MAIWCRRLKSLSACDGIHNKNTGANTMKTHPNLSDADTFYEQLLDAHANLDRDASELLNARLILLLANQIGDGKVLAECLAAASKLN